MHHGAMAHCVSGSRPPSSRLTPLERAGGTQSAGLLLIGLHFLYALQMPSNAFTHLDPFGRLAPVERVAE